jgi:hypothetical protein
MQPEPNGPIEDDIRYVEKPWHIPRKRFFEEHWQYEAGQHVTIIGRTGSGKSVLGFQLAETTMSPDLPSVTLAGKPKDNTIEGFRKRNDLQRVTTWPPPVVKSIWQKAANERPNGWVLWPRHSFNVYRDKITLATEFHKAITDSYRRGNRILIADEITEIQNELKLKEEAKAVWARGRSMGCGLWAFTQRPAWVDPLAYNSAEHILLAYEPDENNRKRFGQIGGVDPKLVESLVLELDKYEFLYIRRSDPLTNRPSMCIITA